MWDPSNSISNPCYFKHLSRGIRASRKEPVNDTYARDGFDLVVVVMTTALWPGFGSKVTVKICQWCAFKNLFHDMILFNQAFIMLLSPLLLPLLIYTRIYITFSETNATRYHIIFNTYTIFNRNPTRLDTCLALR